MPKGFCPQEMCYVLCKTVSIESLNFSLVCLTQNITLIAHLWCESTLFQIANKFHYRVNVQKTLLAHFLIRTNIHHDNVVCLFICIPFLVKKIILRGFGARSPRFSNFKELENSFSKNSSKKTMPYF